ncbi:MAG: hypothetical protein ACKOXB_12550 [Flavobacteriales bacterium]
MISLLKSSAMAFCMLFSLNLISPALHAETTLELSGLIADNNTPLSNVRVTVYEGSIFMSQSTTGNTGKFTFPLEFNKNFKITLEKSGYVSEDISINTVLPLNTPEQNMTYQVSLKMFTVSRDAPFIFEEPVTKIFFNQVIKGFTNEMSYKKSYQEKMAGDPTVHDHLGNYGVSQDFKYELSLRRTNAKKEEFIAKSEEKAPEKKQETIAVKEEKKTTVIKEAEIKTENKAVENIAVKTEAEPQKKQEIAVKETFVITETKTAVKAEEPVKKQDVKTQQKEQAVIAETKVVVKEEEPAKKQEVIAKQKEQAITETKAVVKKEEEPVKKQEVIAKHEEQVATAETKAVVKKEEEQVKKQEVIAKQKEQVITETKAVVKKEEEPVKKQEVIAKQKEQAITETKAVVKKEEEPVKKQEVIAKQKEQVTSTETKAVVKKEEEQVKNEEVITKQKENAATPQQSKEEKPVETTQTKGTFIPVEAEKAQDAGKEHIVENTRKINKTVIKLRGKSIEYTQIIYNNGNGVYYFKNGASISAETYERELKNAKH